MLKCNQLFSMEQIFGVLKVALRWLIDVQLFGLKRYWGVDRSTPNDLVCGEAGRFPIQINASVCRMKYWYKTDTHGGAQTAFERI